MTELFRRGSFRVTNGPMMGASQRLLRLLLWKPNRSAPTRWLLALCVCLLAFLLRLWAGSLHGANPALIFYPALLIVTLFLGWKEGVLVLTVLVALGTFFLLPHGLYLLPVSWAVVGGLNIAIIAGLKSLATQLAAANERQRILFQELQHRVANTLHAVVGNLDIARRRIDTAPSEAANRLNEAAQRLAASADVHRRLHDPALFQRGLETILQDAVASVIDRRTVTLMFDIAPLDLTFDQMSVITMLVIEAANNAQKHVFQHSLGSKLTVLLDVTETGKAKLTIQDDGPRRSSGELSREVGLGLRIVEGLVGQIGGTLTMSQRDGTEISVQFPLRRR